jgi:CheY-like chemotaxis protein/HPt (histidine-containing phosphotransfer) domain-containing protein
MGGKITVESKEGVGSTFRLQLTLSKARISVNHTEADLRGIKVLVVGYNPITLDILENQLSGLGASVTSSGDAGDALRGLLKDHASEPFQLVVVDIVPSELDSLRFVKAVRREWAITGTPLILLTTPGFEIEDACLDVTAACRSLIKPVRTDILRESVLALFGKEYGRPARPWSADERSNESTDSLIHKVKFSGRVLLAEDTLVNQKVAISMLQRMGLSVDLVETGEQAVRAWAENHYDLILMDYQMPVMQGAEAIRRIRDKEQSRGTRTPIVALTADIMAEQQLDSAENDIDGCLTKPFTVDDLVAVLERWLSGGMADPIPSDDLPSTMSITSPLSEQIINMTHFESMRDTLGEDFPELLLAFHASIEQLLAAFPEAIAHADVVELQRLAHSIKSAGANLGAVGLSNLAEKLERQLAENDLSLLEQQVAKVANEFARVNETLAAMTVDTR